MNFCYVGMVLMVNEPDRWIIKIWQEQNREKKNNKLVELGKGL